MEASLRAEIQLVQDPISGAREGNLRGGVRLPSLGDARHLMGEGTRGLPLAIHETIWPNSFNTTWIEQSETWGGKCRYLKISLRYNSLLYDKIMIADQRSQH